jgi:catechol 2,3-dioxygenase-like lactoylglutathione lyase family enzyme
MSPRPAVLSIITADMAAALGFYRQLGLDIPAGSDGEPHVEAALPNGFRLAWDTVEAMHAYEPDWTAPQGDHRMALAFQCDDPAEVDKVYADLTAAGHHGHKEPWDAFWGQRYAVVHDPDGNPVDLFAPLPTP